VGTASAVVLRRQTTRYFQHERGKHGECSELKSSSGPAILTSPLTPPVYVIAHLRFCESEVRSITPRPRGVGPSELAASGSNGPAPQRPPSTYTVRHGVSSRTYRRPRAPMASQTPAPSVGHVSGGCRTLRSIDSPCPRAPAWKHETGCVHHTAALRDWGGADGLGSCGGAEEGPWSERQGQRGPSSVARAERRNGVRAALARRSFNPQLWLLGSAGEKGG
jgi:hypothetical protein